MDEGSLDRVKELIARHTGLLIRPQDEPLLHRVIADRARALHLSSVGQYCHYLESPQGLRSEREELVIPLTTGETYFFRDSGQHALLKERILPDLLENRGAERSLRIWSAACATGEEAYSLAILLDELLRDPASWEILILGTDINHHALEQARRGLYTEWSFRGMSSERRQRYFQRHKGAWLLDERIRRRVRFQQLDLVTDPFPSHGGELHSMDLILCRNTFIYMDTRVVSQVADKLTRTLADGGFLITGHGELYAHHLGELRARVFSQSVVYQRLLTPVAPPPRVHHEMPHPTRRPPAAPRVRRAAAPPVREPVSAPKPPAAERPVQKPISAGMLAAWRYANQGEHEMAEKRCHAMIAEEPFDADPHYLLALLAQEHGDLAAAKGLLKKVIYLAPSFVAAYLDLAELYAHQGDEARAMRMRATARDLLLRLPADEPVRMYGPSTTSDVLHYVGRLLDTHGQ